jgi:alkylated DNA repair protein (DNA oxidative demethylase)
MPQPLKRAAKCEIETLATECSNVPGGFVMSVAMTNCGAAGWVTDHTGYRYDRFDPESGWPWPLLPECFLELAIGAAAEAGYSSFVPDACLINQYEPGARLTLHQDKNERNYTFPIVSVSLGLPAIFQFGGLKRADAIRKYALQHGDVAIWGRIFQALLPWSSAAQGRRTSSCV